MYGCHDFYIQISLHFQFLNSIVQQIGRCFCSWFFHIYTRCVVEFYGYHSCVQFFFCCFPFTIISFYSWSIFIISLKYYLHLSIISVSVNSTLYLVCSSCWNLFSLVVVSVSHKIICGYLWRYYWSFPLCSSRSLPLLFFLLFHIII